MGNAILLENGVDFEAKDGMVYVIAPGARFAMSRHMFLVAISKANAIICEMDGPDNVLPACKLCERRGRDIIVRGSPV